MCIKIKYTLPGDNDELKTVIANLSIMHPLKQRHKTEKAFENV